MLLLLLLAYGVVKAQHDVVPAGGGVTNSSGSLEVTYGQVTCDYATNTGGRYYVGQGVQQPFCPTVYDTIYIDVPYAVHDTTYVDVHDTTYIDVPYAVHDTTIIVDTLILTEYVPVHDTTYITLTDTVTNTLFDTIDNYIYDTTIVTDTLWLTQYDTIWMHDTITIHDTIYITEEGIGDVEALTAKVYSSQGQIVVEGADGNMVTLYDISGRVLATRRDEYAPLRFDIPATGTYLVKVGNAPARRIVVVK